MDTLTQEMRQVFGWVLEGSNFAEAAERAGWSRQATKDRVLKLARSLQEVVGVEHVDDNTEPTLELLHKQRVSYKEALEHYAPDRAIAARGHRVASPADLDQVLGAIYAHSRCSERDAALVLTLFATGAKPGEIALLNVADYLTADGSVRHESVLRAAAAHNGRERPIYFTNARARNAIDLYLTYRVAMGHGVHGGSAYRGLIPDSALFLSRDGELFRNDRTAAITTVQTLFHRLLRNAGTKELSTLSVRRAVADRLNRRGHTLEEIALVLGLDSADSARRLLSGPKPALPQAMAEMF